MPYGAEKADWRAKYEMNLREMPQRERKAEIVSDVCKSAQNFRKVPMRTEIMKKPTRRADSCKNILKPLIIMFWSEKYFILICFR